MEIRKKTGLEPGEMENGDPSINSAFVDSMFYNQLLLLMRSNCYKLTSSQDTFATRLSLPRVRKMEDAKCN